MVNPLQELLQRRMDELHLSDLQVARRAGVSRQTVWGLRTTSKRSGLPDMRTLDKIGPVLGVSPDNLRKAAYAAVGVVEVFEQVIPREDVGPVRVVGEDLEKLTDVERDALNERVRMEVLALVAEGKVARSTEADDRGAERHQNHRAGRPSRHTRGNSPDSDGDTQRR